MSNQRTAFLRLLHKAITPSGAKVRKAALAKSEALDRKALVCYHRTMNYNVNVGDFVQVLVDCKGYSREDAEGLAVDYRGNLGAWISDIGGDENSLAEAKAFLKK